MKFNKNVTRFLRKNGTNILAGLSVIGVGVTAYFSSKSALKYKETSVSIKMENDEEPVMKAKLLKAGLKAYTPTIISGVITSACIIGGQVLNHKQQSKLIAAHLTSQEVFKNYRNKVAERCGEEVDEEIYKEVADPICIRSESYHKTHIDYPDKKVTWYEPLSGTFFEAYEREVMDAEYHLNRNFMLWGDISVSNFLEMFGINTQDKVFNNHGWSMSEGYMWIDFKHRYVDDDGTGKSYYVIDPYFDPLEL